MAAALSSSSSISITAPMRRIPRPQRAIDPSLPVSPLVQRRISPPSCLRAAAPHSHLRTSAACFSTTPSFNFLLGGKKDPKKHQAFVRRWQKRLLGDSEPIGAHVDPYDPLSPVRIAPEEQGEEIEVLEGEELVAGAGGSKLSKTERLAQSLIHRDYEKATHGPLMRVGGKEWVEHAEEVDMAREFEKLTMRTYTPMTQQMADQIEKMTGSFYTLRDENLMLAQTFDEATGKPYTEFSFGRATRVRKPEVLRKNFHQAVVEIHALKQAGQELDMSKQANRGVYESPKWIQDVKLTLDGEGNSVFSFPKGKSLETLLETMQRVPDYAPPAPEGLETEGMEGELLAEEGAPLAAEAVSPPPTMDPATPEFKRAALVKDDEDKPKFDFMSNRPVPRAPKPAAPKPAAPVEPVVENVVITPAATPSTPKFDFDAALATSASTLGELRHAVLEAAARSAEHDVSAIRASLRDSTTARPSKKADTPDTPVTWQHIPLADLDVKFALSKRLAQLTGHYISDPHLTSARTVGDLYHRICGAAKPVADTVYSWINVEGSRQNAVAKKQGQISPAARPAKVKTAAGELLKMGNVELRLRKASATELRRRSGLQKVVSRELREKGLGRERVGSEAREKVGEMRAWAGVVPEWGYKGAARVDLRE